jgi:hypothetical protein
MYADRLAKPGQHAGPQTVWNTMCREEKWMPRVRIFERELLARQEGHNILLPKLPV